MSLGSSNMAGTALGTARSLLLYASIIQVVRMTCSAQLQDAEVAPDETTEAVVGQNVTLTCPVKKLPDLKIVSIEWGKKENGYTKLVLYSPGHGVNYFWHNVTVEAINDHANSPTGSYLHLPAVEKWDSGIYTCDTATFPYGAMRKVIELKIKDAVKIMCDRNSTVNVRNGENVTIHCRASTHARYRWTKNKELVSEDDTLELQRVTDAHAGVYTLTVNTGNESLHEAFTITVLTTTTSLGTDGTTAAYVTEEGLTETSDSSLTTSRTGGLSTAATSVTWTMSTVTETTDVGPNPSNRTIAAGEHVTRFTNYTHVSATSSPDPSRVLNATTSSHGRTVFRSTQETARGDARNESTLRTAHPEDTFSVGSEESSTTGNVTEMSKSPGASMTSSPGAEDTARSHVVVFIIVPMLVLIALAGFLYRRHVIKKRMALPPPFKPPPPPVKYTSARSCNISMTPFPISRCNSVTELKDMKQMFFSA